VSLPGDALIDAPVVVLVADSANGEKSSSAPMTSSLTPGREIVARRGGMGTRWWS